MKDRIIIALDTQDKNELNTLLDNLNEATYFKVGMEAFYTFGVDLLKELKKREKKIFLDLKLHDIPNTVAKSLKSLCQHDIDMINIHATGGMEMMKKARSIVPHHIKLIAVTALTSHSQRDLKNDFGINTELPKIVDTLAALTKDAGVDGVVCSAHEVGNIKELCGNDFITVTPGIRLAGDDQQDQKRVMTPKDAFKAGSDYLVMGRSITQAQNPNETFIKMLGEL
tara:strand:+ start:73942 stop:74619 length:678 start_codon:yes stop_codon:yes gene_type:complete